MKPRENPDYVKFANDKKQKRITIRQLRQKIENEEKYINHREEWIQADVERLNDVRIKVKKMKLELESLLVR